MSYAFNHILRSEGKDPELWNIATDGVINQFLKRDGLKMAPGGVDMVEAVNYDAEQLYEKLLQEKQQRHQQQSSSNSGQQQSAQQDQTTSSNDSQNQNQNDNEMGKVVAIVQILKSKKNKIFQKKLLDMILIVYGKRQ